jgi:glyoxylase-like metal-dependent hydrolase (beta-lactamase superfamily II)
VSAIPFVAPPRDVVPGRVEQVADGLRRVIAANPSRFTATGTGTYIVGRGDVAIIDPGPALDAHGDALLAAVAGERVRALLVTHCHRDHSPLAARLKAETGAPTFAYGPHPQVPGEADLTGEGEEGHDADFVPDVELRDGDVAVVLPGGVTLRAVHTPGHTSNHLCYSWDERRALFTGDHVMGWSTTVVSPPDGNMADYVASLRKVIVRDDAVLWPTHGSPVTAPQSFLAAYLQHRLAREAAVVAQLRAGSTGVADIVAVLYADVPEALHRAAARSVLAHLEKLVADGLVVADGELSAEAAFRLR